MGEISAMDELISEAELCRRARIKKSWFREQVKSLNPPPSHILQGQKRKKYRMSEVLTWMEEGSIK